MLKKTRRKRADGRTTSGGFGKTEGLPWKPMPYDGLDPNGRRTWINGGTIRFEVGDDIYFVESLSLAMLLNDLGITDGDQRDWLENSRVAEWVKLNGVKKDKRVI